MEEFSMIKKSSCWIIALIFLAIPLCTQEKWPEPDAKLLKRAKALLREVPLIEGHNDLATSIMLATDGDLDRANLANHQPQLSADIPRLQEGMVGAQFWPVWVPSEYMHQGTALRGCLLSIDLVHRFVSRYSDLEFAYTADDIERVISKGKIASILAVEGGYMIEKSLPVLRMFYNLGARYMTLTHMMTTSWADAATDFPRHGGLTEFGEEVVREMNRLGMFIDLSHVSAEAAKDSLRVSRAPVIFSHSNALAINPHPRNVPDEVLRLLAKNGGVIMVNFISSYNPPTAAEWNKLARQNPGKAQLASMKSWEEPVWAFRYEEFAEHLRAKLDDEEEIARLLQKWTNENPKPRGTLGDVADHIDHVRKVAGIDHIGIGSDFYDSGESSMVYGLKDVSRYPYLFAELLHRGYSDEDVKKIAGLNLLRAMRQMEQVARKLQNERGPSMVRFPDLLKQF
jgi:membrane dipeptidase